MSRGHGPRYPTLCGPPLRYSSRRGGQLVYLSTKKARIRVMSIRAFRGLNNVTDPLRLGPGWLAQADNVNITDTGAIERRGGYSLAAAGAFTGAYTTIDFSRFYTVDGGALKAMAPPAAGVALRGGITSAPMYWAETNDHVFYNNGASRGVIRPDDTVLDWEWPVPGGVTLARHTGTLAPGLYRVCCTYTLPDGRETGAGPVSEIVLGEGESLAVTDIPHQATCITNVYIAPANSTVFQLAAVDAGASLVWGAGPDVLGAELLNPFLDPLPRDATVIQFWRGRAYAAQHLPNEDTTVIWASEPLGYHLFNLNSGFIMVPGKVEMLAPHDDALIIGTTARVHAYDGEKLRELAPYGVAAGQHWARDDDDTICFWTTRGACRALPFKNLTERQVSVAPGVHAGGTIVRDGGQKRYVVALQQGGSAFNSRP